MSPRSSRPHPAKLTIAGQLVLLDAPGLKVVRRGNGRYDLYWVAAEDAVARGYPTKTRRLFVDLSDPSTGPAICDICQAEQGAMSAWLDDPSIDEGPRVGFDGTPRSLIDLYETEPDSAYQDLKQNSAVSYADSLKILRATVGARRLDRVKALDFCRWYKGWRRPSVESGEDRVRRAYGCIQILRVVLAFGVEAGIADCRRLRRDMEGMRFAKNAPREAIVEFDQAKAFVLEALRQDELGLATTQALQYECFLRQSDVIGSWRKTSKAADLQAALKVFADCVRLLGIPDAPQFGADHCKVAAALAAAIDEYGPLVSPQARAKLEVSLIGWALVASGALAPCGDLAMEVAEMHAQSRLEWIEDEVLRRDEDRRRDEEGAGARDAETGEGDDADAEPRDMRAPASFVRVCAIDDHAAKSKKLTDIVVGHTHVINHAVPSRSGSPDES